MPDACAMCGETEHLRLVNGSGESVALCDPPAPKSCWREYFRQRGSSSEAEASRRKAFALARKLGFSSQDRHEFTVTITGRNHDEVSWSDEGTLSRGEWRDIVTGLEGAVAMMDIYRQQMEEAG